MLKHESTATQALEINFLLIVEILIPKGNHQTAFSKLKVEKTMEEIHSLLTVQR